MAQIVYNDTEMDDYPSTRTSPPKAIPTPNSKNNIAQEKTFATSEIHPGTTNTNTQRVSSNILPVPAFEKEELDELFPEISKEINDGIMESLESYEEENEKQNNKEIPSFVTQKTEMEIKKNSSKLLNVDAPTILSLLDTPGVKKIYIQNYKNVFVETDAGKAKIDIAYISENALNEEIKHLINHTSEFCVKTDMYGDIILPGNIRLIYAFPPLATAGTMATLILPVCDINDRKSFINSEIMSKEMLYFLERCMKGQINVLVSSNSRPEGIATLNLLGSFINDNDSIIALDSQHDLMFEHENISKLSLLEECNQGINVIDIAQSIRPDWIVLNELTASNVEDFLDINCYSECNLTTMAYANSAKNLCNNRIPMMYKTNSTKDAVSNALPEMIAESIQIIVHISKLNNITKVINISHVDGLSANGDVNLKDIFVWNKQKEIFEFTGYIPRKILQLLSLRNVTFNDEIFKKDTERG